MSTDGADDPSGDRTSSNSAAIAAMVRSLYPRLMLMLSATFGNPQKLLRPECASLERLNSMIKRARMCPETKAAMPLRAMARTKGVPFALFISNASGATSACLGTALFVTYDGASRGACSTNLSSTELQRAAVCGFLAGTVHGLCSFPVDFLHHSAETKPSYRKLNHLTLVRSVGHSVVRDGMGMMGYFSIYNVVRLLLSEELPRLLSMIRGAQNCDPLQLAMVHQVIPSLVAGGCAGVVYQFVSYPVDVMKTYWLQDRSVMSLLLAGRTIIRKNGWQSLMSPKASLKRSFAPSALGLFAYEMFKAHGILETLPATSQLHATKYYLFGY